MMEPVFKYKKKHTFIIVSAILLATGIGCLLLAMGIKNHFNMDWSIFKSDAAIIIYIGIAIYLVIVAYILIRDKVKRL